MTTAREETVRLADLLRSELHAMAEFLVALSVFDRERRWVELGYRSLFYFLTGELHLPKGPAYYRMTAAGLIQKYPEIVEPLRDGRLNLTSVAQLAKVITPENRGEVLPRFFGTSKREAKEVVAELLPSEAPPVRTVVTSVRGSAAPIAPPARAPAPAVLPEEPTSCQLAVPDVAPPPRERAQVEPLTADLRRMHITVSRRLLDKLARARDVLSHSHPGASEETILEVGLDLIIERHRKRRGIGAKPRKLAAKPAEPSVSPPPPTLATSAAPPPPPPATRSRHVPAEVWRAVWARDGGRCVWPLENGGVCGSTHQLELDHVEGFALGAGTTVDACRILCRFHQDVSARRLYGSDRMNDFTRPKGRCSEPVAGYGRAARRGPGREPRPLGLLVAAGASCPPP